MSDRSSWLRLDSGPNRIEGLIDHFEVYTHGFGKWFPVASILDVAALDDVPSISAFILENGSLQSAVAALGSPIDIAVLGWIDDAVLVIPFVSEGLTGLRDAAEYMETYRPEENGTAALLVASADWRDLVLVDVSFSNDRISVERLRRGESPGPSYRLIHPDEAALVGQWSFGDLPPVADRTCTRIAFLVSRYLVELARSADGWSKLFEDPADLRLWELTYPNGEMHGGGPPALRCIPREQARLRYGIEA